MASFLFGRKVPKSTQHVSDETLLSVGSFNWLSADRAGLYARHETSLVYRGTHLSNEIEVIAGSLRQRAAAGGV